MRNDHSPKAGYCLRISSTIARLIPILILALASCLPADAREKSDIVVLKNGNRLNGEIRKLDRGLLTVKTDSMSTIEIKWEDVDRIESNYFFTVEDTQGWIYVGSIKAADAPRFLDVIGPVPAHNLNHLAVVGIREFERNLWQRFSGGIELGYTFTKASERTQFNLRSDLNYRAQRNEAYASFDTILSSSKGETDINRQAITFGGNRYFTGKWLLFYQGKVEHNLELELDRRFSLQSGPGYIISKTNRSEFTLGGGFSYTRERYFEEEGVNNAEAVVGITAQFFKLHSPKIDLTVRYILLPNLTTSGRVRSEFDSKLRLEVFRDFYVNFSFYDSYDTKPPLETATGHDYGFITGISWSFNR
jgi:hypothetical protein